MTERGEASVRGRCGEWRCFGTVAEGDGKRSGSKISWIRLRKLGVGKSVNVFLLLWTCGDGMSRGPEGLGFLGRQQSENAKTEQFK